MGIRTSFIAGVLLVVGAIGYYYTDISDKHMSAIMITGYLLHLVEKRYPIIRIYNRNLDIHLVAAIFLVQSIVAVQLDHEKHDIEIDIVCTFETRYRRP